MAAGTWTDVTTYNRRTRKLTSAVSGGASTETAPTTDTSYGVNISGVDSCRVIVAAVSGQTLSGSGSLDLYFLDPDVGLWAPVYSSAGDVVSLSLGAVVGRFQAFQHVVFPGNAHGSFAYIPNTVAVSGGTTIVVHHVCTTVFERAR